jgi:hypothetical protein
LWCCFKYYALYESIWMNSELLVSECLWMTTIWCDVNLNMTIDRYEWYETLWIYDLWSFSFWWYNLMIWYDAITRRWYDVKWCGTDAMIWLDYD